MNEVEKLIRQYFFHRRTVGHGNAKLSFAFRDSMCGWHVDCFLAIHRALADVKHALDRCTVTDFFTNPYPNNARALRDYFVIK